MKLCIDVFSDNSGLRSISFWGTQGVLNICSSKGLSCLKQQHYLLARSACNSVVPWCHIYYDTNVQRN